MYGAKKTAFLVCSLLLVGCSKQNAQIDTVPNDRIISNGRYVDINPRFSHDGKRIVFLRETPDRKLQLHISDAKLHHPVSLMPPEIVLPDRPYSSNLARYNSPDTLAWSPDDRKVAFERIDWFTFESGERLPGTGLWTFDLASGKVQALAIHPQHYSSLFYFYHFPGWSPDGKYFTFSGEGINGQRAIFKHSASSKEVRDSPSRFDRYEDSDWPVWNPRFAPPDRSVSYCFRQSEYQPLAAPAAESIRMSSPGKNKADHYLIWKNNPRENSKSGYTTLRPGHFSWSDDGKQLAFTITSDPVDYTSYQIWKTDIDSAKSERVSPDDGHGYLAPVWIDKLHLGALQTQNDHFSAVSLDIKTKQIKVIGNLPTSDFDWSPDRKFIVYTLPRTPFKPDVSMPSTLRILPTNLEKD